MEWKCFGLVLGAEDIESAKKFQDASCQNVSVNDCPKIACYLASRAATARERRPASARRER